MRQTKAKRLRAELRNAAPEMADRKWWQDPDNRALILGAAIGGFLLYVSLLKGHWVAAAIDFIWGIQEGYLRWVN